MYQGTYETKNGTAEKAERLSRDADDSGCKQQLEVIESFPMHQPLEGFALEECAKYAWYQIDESSLPLLSQLEPSLRQRYLKIGLLPGPRRYEFGRFQRNQNQLSIFEAIPALGEVGYTELRETSSETGSDPENKDEEHSPLAAFLNLTGRTDPVPEILVEMDDRSDDERTVRLMRDREIVDSLDPVGGAPADFELDSNPAAAAVWTCFVGGLDAFKNAYCVDWDIDYCDNGAWTHLIRTSGSSKRRHSFTRVASCFGTAQVWHFWRGYWFGWKWFVASIPFEPNQQLVAAGHVRSRHYKGGSKRRRKIEVSKWTNHASQYFRVFTSFHN